MESQTRAMSSPWLRAGGSAGGGGTRRWNLQSFRREILVSFGGTVACESRGSGNKSLQPTVPANNVFMNTKARERPKTRATWLARARCDIL